MVMSRDQNVGRSHNIKKYNNSFERVKGFKYLGTTLTDQNSIREEEIEVRKACCYSVQNLLSSRFLSKQFKD
jgi:hypothetical protein